MTTLSTLINALTCIWLNIFGSNISGVLLVVWLTVVSSLISSKGSLKLATVS